MTMAGRGLLRVRRGLAALAAACLPVLAGCSHATPPAPVATSLPSSPTWLCPGVPWEAVSPIVGSGPYVLPLFYDSKNVYYCRIEAADTDYSPGSVFIEWGPVENLAVGPGESYFEGRKSLFKGTNGFSLPDLDGEGGMVVDTDKAVAAAWRCGTDDATDEERGIILEVWISDADRGRRNLRQDAVGIITLIEPWACGEQPVPGGTATSPVNRPWPTAYPDSDSD
jgi:lipoprotein